MLRRHVNFALVTAAAASFSSSTLRHNAAPAAADGGNNNKAKAKKWEQHSEWDRTEFAQAEQDAQNQQQQQEAQEQDENPYEDLIAAHRVLGTRPGDPLYRIKLSYMMRCRECHPEVDGNPATFYKIALAYERIMKDRGIEMRDGRIVFSENVPKFPKGHDLLAEVSRDVLIKAAEEVPGVDRYERSAALEHMREVRMSLAGTSEMLTHPATPANSEMKALESLELNEGILLTPQAGRGMPWHEQPFRMLTSEVRMRDGDAAAKLLEEIVAPVQLRIGGASTTTAVSNNNASSSSSPALLPGETEAEQQQKKLEAAAAAASTTAPAVPSAVSDSSSSTTTSTALVEEKVYESVPLAPVTDEITPQLLHKADEIQARADNEKGVLKYRHPEATTWVTDYLGPGTMVVAARQFEALGRAGKMSTYARYSNFPHPPKLLSQLPKDLDADHMLRPEEEEAVARSIIHKQMDEGKIASETVLNYLHKSTSVAGYAAQTATMWMESTEERGRLFTELALFLALLMALVMCGLATLAAYLRYNRVFNNDAAKKKGVQQYVNLDTMLPWWGNDALYEENVKRIFLEEYRKGRQAAEQMKHYQAGLEQETKTLAEKREQELKVFEVSRDDVKRMRARVIRQVSPEEPEEQKE